MIELPCLPAYLRRKSRSCEIDPQLVAANRRLITSFDKRTKSTSPILSEEWTLLIQITAADLFCRTLQLRRYSILLLLQPV